MKALFALIVTVSVGFFVLTAQDVVADSFNIEADGHGLEDIFYTFLGFILFNAIEINRDRNRKKFDSDNNGYSWREIGNYLKYNNIAIFISVVVAIICYIFCLETWTLTMDQLVKRAIIDTPIKFGDYAYVGAGGFAILAQWIFKPKLPE